MLAITLILLICQNINLSWSTRLPLEVYELTPATVIAHQAAVAAAAAATNSGAFHSATSTSTSSSSSSSTLTSTSTLASNLKAATKTLNLKLQENSHHLANRNLEYSIINPPESDKLKNAENFLKTLQSSPEDSTGLALEDDTEEEEGGEIKTDVTSTRATPSSIADNQLDRRRSRQMLDEILQNQQNFNIDLQNQQPQYDQINRKLVNHNNFNKKNNFNENNNNNENNNIIDINYNLNINKDIRILYQVGDSEDDLPICAPNAVCSKIDLYETPWIERQCRCPPTTGPNVVIHHHHHHHDFRNNKNYNSEENDINKNLNSNIHSKYHTFLDKGKHLYQHKHFFVGDFNDKKFENLHLKKLMQKLGAVYEEDLHLEPNDISDNEYKTNDGFPVPVDEIDLEMLENDLPTHKKYSQSRSRNSYTTVNVNMDAGSESSVNLNLNNNGAHMRHSGHLNHRPISFIGGCPSSLGIEDGHTIADKTRHYKLCQPVHKLPVCRHFRDYTWTLTTLPELNVTEQIVHCRCPKNSVTYLTKREPAADGSNGYNYLFACSPLTRIRCQRKQPCKLFTVRKRQEFLDEVNINSLCQCPKGHHCPSHHTQSAVIAGESFLEDNIQTFSGYCMAND